LTDRQTDKQTDRQTDRQTDTLLEQSHWMSCLVVLKELQLDTAGFCRMCVQFNVAFWKTTLVSLAWPTQISGSRTAPYSFGSKEGLSSVTAVQI